MLISVIVTLYTKLPHAREVAPWFPALLIGSALITAVCAAGAWRMRRWSVYLYAFLDISVTLILLFALNYFSIAAFIVRTVLLILLFYFVGLRRGLA